jgi:exosortase
MPQDIATNSLSIRAVVLVGRPDFGRCTLAARSPTALWPVFNQTALELLLGRLANEAVHDVVVCCGREISDIVEPVCRRFGPEVRLLTEDLAAGTGGCLRDAGSVDPGDVIVVFSGSMVSAPRIRDLVDAHLASGATMTMAFNPSGTGETVPDQPAEIYVCKPEVLSYIPRGGYSDIKEGLIPAILSAGGTIRPAVLAEEVGNFHDRDSYLNALFAHLARHGNVAVMGAPGCGGEPLRAADVSIHPTAKVCGPVLIAERARVLDDALIIGPAVVGSGAVVGRGSVVVRSVLWDEVSIGDRCEVRECVVDHQVAIPDGAVFVDHAVTADKAGRHGKSKVAAPAEGGLDSLWRGRRKDPALVFSAAAIVVAFLWSYWPTIMDLWGVWKNSYEDSAGLLVPFLALYVAWLRREDIRRAKIRPAIVAGTLAFIVAQIGRSIGLCFMYGSGERFSMILSIGAIILLLCGWTVLRKTATILLFLCLMLPWPNSIQSRIGVPLQNWATTSAVFCLELAGYTVLREGNVITIGDATVAVAEACNGLRMITAFFVIGGLVVLLVQRAWWEKTLVFASSVPIAMLCNTLRLTATAVAFTILKGDYWTKMFHDFGGYAMMPLALGLVVGEFWMLTRLTTAPDQAKRIVIARRKS